MGNIVVTGGSRLNGEVMIQGSKNLAIPCLAALVLFSETVVLQNVPDIADVRGSLAMLECLGAAVERKGSDLIIHPENISRHMLYGACDGGRSSVLYCGPLLARFGKCACVSPQGCKIGKRPTDLHRKIFKSFGAKETAGSDETELSYFAEEWKGCRIVLPIRSVGATESAVLSAVLAKGTTEIYGYAREPEIMHLCDFLVKAGADIEFHSECDKIVINGVERLARCSYRLAPDRIVAGTYMIYGCMCGGSVRLLDAPVSELETVIGLLRKAGAEIETGNNLIELRMNRHPVSVGVVETEGYPGFPTDLQSLLLALETISEGEAIIVENIFESRFETASLLKKMGACVEIEDNTAYIKGVGNLTNCNLSAPDLRGGAAVLGAMLAGKGKAVLEDTEVIERGYEDIAGDLKRLGFTGLEV